MRTLITFGLAATAFAALACSPGRYEKREFFARGQRIGITDPIADKDGTWWMAIDHHTAILHSGQYVQRWDAEVAGHTIVLRALVVPTGALTEWWYGSPEYGAHIDVLDEGVYSVVYRDPSGTESSCGRVTARRLSRLPEAVWQWSRLDPVHCRIDV